MKNTLIALAAIFTMAFASTANANSNFNNNTFNVTAVSESIDFTIDGDSNGFTNAELGVTVLPHTFGEFGADLRLAFTYDLDSARVGLRSEYGIFGAVTDRVFAYGVAAVEYSTTASDLSNGDFILDPRVGVSYLLTDRASVFGEVGYAWNMSNSFSREGGYVEVGTPFSVTDSVTLTPSVVREFGNGNRDYNFNLGVVFSF